MGIGENIKLLRTALKLTQKELAEKCGVAEITIRQYENGKREPKTSMVVKIADALHASPAALVFGSEMYEDWQEDLSSSQMIFESFHCIKAILEDNNRSDISTGLPEEDLLYYFWKLGKSGQDKAIEQVELLTKIPEYKKDSE